MWIAKLQLRHEDCPIVTRCQKFNLIVLSYPSTWYEKKKHKYATTTCYFQTNDEGKKQKFLIDLKADRRITNLEISGDIFTYEIDLGKEGEHVMLYHQKQIFFVKPVVNHYDGHEYWEVAAWKRENLELFIKALKEHMDIAKILKLENSPLTDVYFPNVMPKLSKGQKNALELAYSVWALPTASPRVPRRWRRARVAGALRGTRAPASAQGRRRRGLSSGAGMLAA